MAFSLQLIGKEFCFCYAWYLNYYQSGWEKLNFLCIGNIFLLICAEFFPEFIAYWTSSLTAIFIELHLCVNFFKWHQKDRNPLNDLLSFLYLYLQEQYANNSFLASRATPLILLNVFMPSTGLFKTLNSLIFIFL